MGRSALLFWTQENFSHHPNSHFNYPPNHCKEKGFDLVCFQQASVSLCLVLTLPPIPTRLMNFSPLLSLFNLCLQVVHQALLHLGNQRITGTARVPRNGGTQERSIFVGIHGGGPTSFSVTSLEFRKLWAAVKVKSKGLRMAKHGDVVLFRSLFLVLEFLRLLE